MSTTSSRRLSPEAVGFRKLVIDALWDESRFGYVDSNRFVGTCLLCGDAIVVRFAGLAPRASLNCHGGCTEASLAPLLGLEARP